MALWKLQLQARQHSEAGRLQSHSVSGCWDD
jgi:hypothetical protein